MKEISTIKMWLKANNDGDFAKFSTKSPDLVFFFFCEKNIISLIFLIFCLDKGVHFTVPVCRSIWLTGRLPPPVGSGFSRRNRRPRKE